MITLKHVSVTFPQKPEPVHAVKDVSLTIEEGEIFGIVGFSGAGKSTLVRTINMLERPTAGEVWVKGEELTQLSEKELRPHRRNMGMIFQHFNLFNARTVYQNVYYPLRKLDLPQEEKDARVRELLSLVDMEERMNAYPRELSGGQKQRVAIARALATKPDILLCDEATSALDPKTTRSILELLRRLNEELGLTIVMITHQMEVIKAVCHRAAVMEAGHIIECGRVLDIFSQPQEELTREIVGTDLITPDMQEQLEDQIKPEETLVHFVFIGSSAMEPLMVHIYKKFAIETNILFGSLEYLNGQPLGNLIVGLTDPENRLEEALTYLRQQDVLAEVLSCSKTSSN